MIKLDDDDEIAKIDEEVHNELNLLFSSSMSSNENPPYKSVILGNDPSTTLDVAPLASFPPFAYVEQDWDVDTLL